MQKQKSIKGKEITLEDHWDPKLNTWMVRRLLNKKYRKTTESLISDKTITTENVTLVFIKDKDTAQNLNTVVCNIATIPDEAKKLS